MNKLLGHFYFRKTKNGNLIGEFSNNLENKIYTESSDLHTKKSDNYIGKYISTWQENKGMTNYAELIIEYRTETENKIFKLTWKNKQGNIIFIGEGMLCEDFLIGHYIEGEGE